MSFRELDIKRSYISYGDENIASSFLVPTLKHTKLYRRSVGFFSSSVFAPTGKLQEYLLDVDEQVKRMKEQIVHEMAAKDGLNEALKESAPMEWVGRMNQYCYAAEEIINRELIYHLAVNPNG